MKGEMTDKVPAFNLLGSKEIKDQVETKKITHVLLNDGNWYEIQPGSFHFYQTKPGSDGQRPGVPYVTFTTTLGNRPMPVTVECFPATVAGWAY